MTTESDHAGPVTAAEAAALFADLKQTPGLVLAVSGGPDSTALLFLLARWRKRLTRGPKLLAVTVDHGLRREARREAQTVKRVAAWLGVPHRVVRWEGPKPGTGIQAAARQARYRLLAAQAHMAGAEIIVTAHTLDDQAETVLLRLARGSGIAGLAGMARRSPLPVGRAGGVLLIRPLLCISKARLIATLRKAGLDYVEDPSNHDPRFTRGRLRELIPALAVEGLNRDRLALLGERARRADEALSWLVAQVENRCSRDSSAGAGRVAFALSEILGWPDEVVLRVLRNAIERYGNEGPVELGKLEGLLRAVHSARRRGNAPFRRTLAGALVTCSADRLVIEQAPVRRAARTGRDAPLTS